MRRDTSARAVRSAFSRSAERHRLASPDNPIARTRLHPWALAFVVGFPGMIGVAGIVANIGRDFDRVAWILFGLLPVIGAIALLVLGIRSEARVDADGLSVRFFGFRTTTVRFANLRSVTFAMSVPSISFTLILTDDLGRSARIHANWWRNEGVIVRPMLRRVIELDVAMDRTAARIVSDVLGVKRPTARIVHHGLFNRNRTW